MPTDHTPTGFSTIKVGVSSFLGGVLTTALAGSVIIGGNWITDLTLNSAPSAIAGTGSYLTYQEARLAASGSATLKAEIALSTTFASGGILRQAAIECGNAGMATTGSLVVTAIRNSGLVSATAVRHFIRIATGSSVLNNSGAIKIPDNGYVAYVTATGSKTGIVLNDCKLKVWTHEKYAR